MTHHVPLSTRQCLSDLIKTRKHFDEASKRHTSMGKVKTDIDPTNGMALKDATKCQNCKKVCRDAKSKFFAKSTNLSCTKQQILLWMTI